MRPSSSAPHHANRTVFWGLDLAICCATSSRAAEPLPLSLMPGPAARVEVGTGHDHIVIGLAGELRR